MKIKNKISEQSHAKLKSSPRFKDRLNMSGISFLILCFLASLANANIHSEQLDPVNLLMSHLAEKTKDAKITPARIQPVKSQPAVSKKSQTTHPVPINFAAQIDKKSSQNDLLLAENPDTALGLQLWHDRIAVVKDPPDTKNKNELQSIIDKIRSVEFKIQQTPAPAIIAEAIKIPTDETITEPEKIQPKKETPTETPQKPQEKAEPKSDGQVTQQTLEKIESLSQYPEQVENPFKLAEVMFNSSNIKQAAFFYQQALSRSDPNEHGLTQDRAWILFQLGNCLKDEDPETAMKMFNQLITGYPNSPWAELAKVQHDLLSWLQQDKPYTLIKKQ